MHKAYASTFVSWFLTNIKDMRSIKSIIFFGSAAREEAKKDSDIDIFFDVHSATKKMQTRVDAAVEAFYKSREALLFKTKGIDNRITVIVGKLEEWKELKQSIEATGIVLFGPYISGKVHGRKQVVISWSRIRKNRGAALNKIYGFQANEKRYPGLLEKLDGRKLGKSTIMVPIEHKDEILTILKDHEGDATLLEGYF
ncbi:MAG: nucleotidyltransferase domain-containing protein [Nanoarchaeota archaeon]